MLALVLGGSYDHIYLLETLSQRNYTTHLVDHSDNPPGKSYCDFFTKADAYDFQTVKKIAEKRQANLIIATCSDQGFRTACLVAESLSLPTIFPSSTVKMSTNKVLMKNFMVDNKLPTSEFLILSSETDLKKVQLKFPLILKPSDNHGSNGVFKVTSKTELLRKFKSTLSHSRDKKVILERFIPGKEISVDAIIKDNKAIILSISQVVKYKINENESIISQIVSFELDNNLYKLLLEIITKITSLLKINNCAFLIQLIIKNRKLNIIEFSPRVGGGLKYLFCLEKTGVNLIYQMVNAFGGNTLDFTLKERPLYSSQIFIFSNFDRVNFEHCLIKLSHQKIISNVLFFSEKSNKFNASLPLNRIGVLSVQSNNLDSLKGNLKKVKALLNKIIGLEGIYIE